MDVIALALAKKGAGAGAGEKGDKGDKGDTGVGVKSITSTNNTADGGTSVIRKRTSTRRHFRRSSVIRKPISHPSKPL